MDSRTETMPAPKVKPDERIAKYEVKDGLVVFTIVSGIREEVEEQTEDMDQVLERLHAKYEPFDPEQAEETAGDDSRLRRFLLGEK